MDIEHIYGLKIEWSRDAQEYCSLIWYPNREAAIDDLTSLNGEYHSDEPSFHLLDKAAVPHVIAMHHVIAVSLITDVATGKT